MLLHLDGSRHRWFSDDRWYDLLVVLDDATSQIYYAQLVEQESTRTVLAALRQVVEQQGVFCALYSDRASHFWLTPKAGEVVDRQRLTQVGRALRELSVQMIPAYSPQARGRSERNFDLAGTAATGVAPCGITTPEQANRFLRKQYVGEFNRRFAIRAAEPGGAFLRCPGETLGRIFDPAPTGGQSGQHRRGGESLLADREDAVAGDAGRLPGHRLRAPGRDAQHWLWAAHRGLLHRPRSAAGGKKVAVSKGCGKDGCCATLEIPSGFPLSHSLHHQCITGHFTC
jgi:hypothetical protein